MTPEQVARKLLSQVSYHLPVDVKALARRLGVDVIEQDLEDSVSGMLAVRDGQATIVVNQHHAHRRQRFTIAHELGHYCLHRMASNVFIDVSPVYFRDSRSSEGTYPKEQEANRFAAELLMPATVIRDKVNKSPIDAMDDDAVRMLADEFDVSVQSLSIRLTNLGLISQM